MKRFMCVVGIVMFMCGGCAHNLTIIPKNGNISGNGKANEMGKSIMVNINNKMYTGRYAHSMLTDSGKAYMSSSDGSSISCDFIYSNFSGLGTCEDEYGEKYDIIID